MTKKEILDYVMENPGNTNVSVLGPMVDAVAGVTPTGKITITENGNGIDVSQYAKADVNVPSSGGLETCTLTLGLQNLNNYEMFGKLTVSVLVEEDGEKRIDNWVLVGVGSGSGIDEYYLNGNPASQQIVINNAIVGQTIRYGTWTGLSLTHGTGDIENDSNMVTILGDCELLFDLREYYM